MKKVWIIAPFTGIEENNYRNRFIYIARLLANEGYDVSLFTSNYSHFHKKKLLKNSIKKYEFNIELIKEPGYKKNVSLGRILSHMIFSLNLSRKIKKNEAPDLLYVAFPTISASIVSQRYADKNNIPVIIDIQDTWPESIAVAIDVNKSIINSLIKPIKYIVDNIFKNANAIIGVSQTYVDRAKVQNSKSNFFEPIFIGSEISHFDNVNNLIEFKKTNKEIFLVYIGTLSYSYDLETAIRALKNIKSNYTLKLYILGDGPDKEKLISISKELKLLNEVVFFMGYMHYEEMVSILKMSDIGLNSIMGSSKATITNKLGDYLAAGLPLMNSCESREIKNLITNKKIGENYKSGDVKDFERTLISMVSDREKLNLYGLNAKKLANDKFNRNISYKPIVSIIKELIENKEIGL